MESPLFICSIQRTSEILQSCWLSLKGVHETAEQNDAQQTLLSEVIRGGTAEPFRSLNWFFFFSSFQMNQHLTISLLLLHNYYTSITNIERFSCMKKAQNLFIISSACFGGLNPWLQISLDQRFLLCSVFIRLPVTGWFQPGIRVPTGGPPLCCSHWFWDLVIGWMCSSAVHRRPFKSHSCNCGAETICGKQIKRCERGLAVSLWKAL